MGKTNELKQSTWLLADRRLLEGEARRSMPPSQSLKKLLRFIRLAMVLHMLLPPWLADP